MAYWLAKTFLPQEMADRFFGCFQNLVLVINSMMKSLPLHLKVSIIASAISFIILLSGFIIICANIADRIQEEEKILAKYQTSNLAEQLSIQNSQIDEDELQRLTTTISTSHPNLVTVRIWKFESEKFVQFISSNDNLSADEISDEIRVALLNKVVYERFDLQKGGKINSLLRVFSPVVSNGNVTGAVETVTKLETIWSISVSYLASLSWIALATLFLMTIAFYLVLKKLVYVPLEHLLAAMEKAEKGNLRIEIEETENPDEFGKLSNNFNKMMLQIRQMTDERTQQNDILQERVKEATQELTNKNEQIEQAHLELFHSSSKMLEMERLVAVGQNAAQFAHEVGTPLNLISGHVQLLQNKFPEDSPESKRLQIITTQIERIEKIVREMLDRARHDKTTHQKINLNQILRKTLEAIEPILAELKVEAITDFAEELPSISGNSERLQQVFLNLFKNALDALPEGGTISLSTRSEGQKVLVDFTDDGIGMSEEIAAKIFQPLFTTKKRGQGTGLGLVIVKQILEEHNAEISVKSKQDTFTTFTIIFPQIQSVKV